MLFRDKVTGEQTKLVEELYAAFQERDYPACVRHAFNLGMTLGSRVFTGILTMGLDLKVYQEPSLQIILIYTVAHQRLGDSTGAEAAFMMNSMVGGSIRGWLLTLLALCLRRTNFETALAAADDDQKRLQVHYYEAEGLLSDRRPRDALEMFRRTLDLPGDGPERIFARARISWLESEELLS